MKTPQDLQKCQHCGEQMQTYFENNREKAICTFCLFHTRLNPIPGGKTVYTSNPVGEDWVRRVYFGT